MTRIGYVGVLFIFFGVIFWLGGRNLTSIWTRTETKHTDQLPVTIAEKKRYRYARSGAKASKVWKGMGILFSIAGIALIVGSLLSR